MSIWVRKKVKSGGAQMTRVALELWPGVVDPAACGLPCGDVIHIGIAPWHVLERYIWHPLLDLGLQFGIAHGFHSAIETVDAGRVEKVEIQVSVSGGAV